MAPKSFIRNDTASFPRIVEENLSLLEETYEGTVLHLATQRGHEVEAKKIIELCPSLISSTNSRGDTPLHIAANLGHTSILIWMLESMKLRNVLETNMMNKDGLTALHCAVMKGSVDIIREFLDKAPSAFHSVTIGKHETVFHIAARHKNIEAFIFMEKSVILSQLLYQLDGEDNTVLHIAASVGFLALVKYITEETKVEITTKNKKGYVAVDLLNEDNVDFLELSTALKFDVEILIECPSNCKVITENSENQIADDERKKRQKEMVRVRSSESLKKTFDMQLEALQSARTTLTVVAVLIASVAFTCGINPPGGVSQEAGAHIGKSTVGKTLAFAIFSISNSIALFTSMCMVILLLSFIPYREDSLLKLLVVAHWMMWTAVAAMASAYVAAAAITLPHFGETKWLLHATLAIACLTLGSMFVYLRFSLAKCMLRKMKYLKCLSKSPVRECGLNMAANITKGHYSY